MNRLIYYIVYFFIAIHSCWLLGQDGEAGRESPFSIGVGARALGMGNAAVAFPDDPSAFAWNPAGMVVVEQKRIGLSLTTLFEGTQYNFIGFIYPTMSAGTFGFGVSRIGTGGIKHTKVEDGAPFDTGEEIDYWWGKLTLSYALTIVNGLSLGVNFNANRQVLWLYSTNGFGADFGAHYKFLPERGILSNLFLGCLVVNGISPRLKLGTQIETIPYMFKGGIAKYFLLRGGADRWLFVADFEKGDRKQTKYHMGTEYSWSQIFYLRFGLDNGEFGLGGGLRYRNFQVDYGMSRIGDPEFFPRSHRFSLVFYIGKSISEKKQLLEEQRRLEIQSRINERIEEDRQKRITESLRAGREYIEKEDYFNARLEFVRVLQEDKRNTEARDLLDMVMKKDEELQKQREEALLRQEREKGRLQHDLEYVNQRLKDGLKALEERNFRKAIEEWGLALEKDPSHPQIKRYIEQAKSELVNTVNQLIAQASRYRRQGELSEAYKVLNQAKEQTIDDQELRVTVLREIVKLDRYVDFLNNYQAGVQRYGEGDYESATRLLKKALEYDPAHDRAKELYRNSMVRSKGKKLEMGEEAKEKYSQGIRLYSDGRYEEALRIWEEALELEPDNVKILEAIESVNRKIELYRTNK